MDLDSLQIRITADSNSASAALDRLIESMHRLQKAVNLPSLDKTSAKLKTLGKNTGVTKAERELKKLERQATADGDALVKLQRRLEDLQQFRGIGNPLTNSEVENQVAQTEAEIRRLSASVDGLDAKIRATRASIAEGAGSGAAGIEKAAATVRNAASSLDTVSNSTERVKASLDGASSNAQKFGITLKAAGDGGGGVLSKLGGVIKKISLRMAVFSAIHALVNGAAESLGRMAQENEGVNATISKIKSSLQYVCDALAATIYPILKALEPVLTFLLDTLAAILNTLARVIAFFTGQDAVIQAKKQMVDFADSMDSSTAAAKRLKRELLPFDELNIFGDNDGGGGGLGNLRFEEVAVDPIKLPDVIAAPEWSPNPVPSPAFETVTVPDMAGETIPSPAWTPDPIPAPTYEKLRIPEENGQVLTAPEWEPNPIPAPEFVGVHYPDLFSAPTLPIPEWEKDPIEAPMVDITQTTEGLATLQESYTNTWESMATSTQEVLGRIEQSVNSFSANTAANLQSWATSVQSNFRTTAEYIPSVTSPALESAAESYRLFLENTGGNVAEWGQNVGSNVRAAMVFTNEVIAAGLSVSGENVATWVNSTSGAFAAWGKNVLENIAATAQGMYNSFVSGLSAAWESFVGFMKGVGEKISNWWDANKSWVVPVVATVAVVGTAVAVTALTGGLSLPAAAAMTAPALAAIPAMAKGGVLTEPTTILAGEYPGAKHNPEIVAPQSILRQTIREENDNLEIINAIYAGVNMLVRAVEDKETNLIFDGKTFARNLYPYMQQAKQHRGGSLVRVGG